MNDFSRFPETPSMLLHDFIVRMIGNNALLKALDEHQMSLDIIPGLSDEEFDAYLEQDVYLAETNSYDDASMEFFMKTKELFGSIDDYSLMGVDVDHITLFKNETPSPGAFINIIHLSHDGLARYRKDRLVISNSNPGRMMLNVTQRDKEILDQAWRKLGAVNTTIRSDLGYEG